MKKQAVARELARRIQARIELEQSLGAGFLPLSLPTRRDLSRSHDNSPNETQPQPPPQAQANAIAAAPKLPHAASPAATATQSVADQRPPLPAPKLQAPAPQVQPQSWERAVPQPNELAKAMGEGLVPYVELPRPEGDPEEIIAPTRSEANACRKCSLCNTRKNVAFGEGDLASDLVFVGEAPGRDEDLQGRPFVGPAGKLLTDMIEKGMKRPRASVYICNILKCRPPGNRDPLPDEIACCVPYLYAQLNLIRPKLLIAVGRISAQLLTGTRLSMKGLRGRMMQHRGLTVMPIYHPAYLLRARQQAGGPEKRTSEDRETWEDLQKAMRFLAGK